MKLCNDDALEQQLNSVLVIAVVAAGSYNKQNLICHVFIFLLLHLIMCGAATVAGMRLMQL
jgi:hypothetical protein